VSYLDRLMPEDVKGYDWDRENDLADRADLENDERVAERSQAEFDAMPVTVHLTRAEASHLLALSLQFGIAERRDTVSRQINNTAMRKLDGALS